MFAEMRDFSDLLRRLYLDTTLTLEEWKMLATIPA